MQFAALGMAFGFIFSGLGAVDGHSFMAIMDQGRQNLRESERECNCQQVHSTSIMMAYGVRILLGIVIHFENGCQAEADCLLVLIPQKTLHVTVSIVTDSNLKN